MSFLLLVATGLPLRFSDAFWAPALINIISNIEITKLLHHINTILTFTYFNTHLL